MNGGVAGNILDSKHHRDILTEKPIKLYIKIFTWLFLLLVNSILLFYVYLFARQQTYQRQQAWLQSFYIWLIFEIFFSSTGIVLFTHLIIPLYIYSDVQKIKSKLLRDLVTYRRNSFKCVPGVRLEGDDDLLTGRIFNSAKYLYTSWRIASLFPDLPESPFILSFTTQWPKQYFKISRQEVSTVYDQRYTFVYKAISRMTIFFVTAYAQAPLYVQDIILELFTTTGFGYLFILLVRLFTINAYLPLLLVFILALLLHFYLNYDQNLQKLRTTSMKELSLVPVMVQNDSIFQKKDPEISVSGEENVGLALSSHYEFFPEEHEISSHYEFFPEEHDNISNSSQENVNKQTIETCI